MINQRIIKAVSYYNKKWGDDISYESLTSKISVFTRKNNLLLLGPVWDDEIIKSRIYQYDMLLMIYNDFLEKSINKLLDKDKILFYEDNYDIGIVYQLKLIYHDLLTLRNLFNQQFEAQLIVISRSVIEKLRVLFVMLIDIEFGKKLIWNTCNYSAKDRYYKLYQPKKIIDKLRDCNDQNFKQLLEILVNERINDMYSFQSSFVHSDIFQLLYYNINSENGINISPLKNASDYILHRSDYMTELFIVTFPVLHIKLNANNDDILFKHFILSYYDAYVKDMYK